MLKIIIMDKINYIKEHKEFTEIVVNLKMIILKK
jgi:hypothetical protein